MEADPARKEGKRPNAILKIYGKDGFTNILEKNTCKGA